MTTEDRTYRFAPVDRTGLLLGLSGSQCLLLGAGVLSGGALLQAQAPPLATLVPVIAAVLMAFAKWNGTPVHQLAPIALRFRSQRLAGATRWERPLNARRTSADDEAPVEWPPFLTGLALVDLGTAPWSLSADGVCAVHDEHLHRWSATLPIQGSGFSLLERTEQDRALAGWGDVLAAFCTETGEIAEVRITESASPAGLGEHKRFYDAHGQRAADASRSYEQTLHEASVSSVRHEALLTVTIDERRVRGARGDARADCATGTLLEELRLATQRLDAAGLTVGPPLSPVQTARAIRRRLDPTAGHRAASSLGEAAGLVTPAHAGPLAATTEWRHVTVDGAHHRAFWFEEWPRLDVGPAWLEQLLLHSGGTRTITLIAQPVAPSRSRRRIDRDATRLAADEEQRTRGGFRIGASHRRAQAAVIEREAELVSGFAELEFAGFLTVSAADLDALDTNASDYEQAAARSGIELRALHGRHDHGLACALPIGRGLAPRRIPS